MTPLEVLIADNSFDDYPERQEHENWYHFKLREWFWRVARDAEKKRKGWKPGAVPK